MNLMSGKYLLNQAACSPEFFDDVQSAYNIPVTPRRAVTTGNEYWVLTTSVSIPSHDNQCKDDRKGPN